MNTYSIYTNNMGVNHETTIRTGTIKDIVVLEETELECAICMDTINKGSELSILPCGHAFCKKCTEECLKKDSKHLCMICRQDVTTNTGVLDIKDETVSRLVKLYNDSQAYNGSVVNNNYKLEFMLEYVNNYDKRDKFLITGFNNSIKIFETPWLPMNKCANQLFMIDSVSKFDFITISFFSYLQNRSLTFEMKSESKFNPKDHITRVNLYTYLGDNNLINLYGNIVTRLSDNTELTYELEYIKSYFTANNNKINYNKNKSYIRMYNPTHINYDDDFNKQDCLCTIL